MRYGLIVAALLACGPATARDPDCGTSPNAVVGLDCMNPEVRSQLFSGNTRSCAGVNCMNIEAAVSESLQNYKSSVATVRRSDGIYFALIPPDAGGWRVSVGYRKFTPAHARVYWASRPLSDETLKILDAFDVAIAQTDIPALTSCGTGPNSTRCTTTPPPDCGIDPNNVYGVGCMNPVLKQPTVYFQPIPDQRKLAIFRGHPNPTFIGIGVGAIQSHVWGDNVIAVGRCAGASLVKGSDVILLGDYTATPGPETSNFINWRNKTCLQDGVVVQCPPPEPECIK